MSANRDREEEIFDAGRELAVGERAADLRRRIEGMLQADAAAGEFFKTLQQLSQLHEATGGSVVAAEWNKKLAEFDQVGAEKQVAMPEPKPPSQSLP